MSEVIIQLTGKTLLQKVKESSSLSKREQAKICGYYSNSKDSANLSEFYEALIQASGIPLDPDSTKNGRGREPNYRVSVHKNGQIVIGSSYTESMGLVPGDEFEIKLGYKHIQLRQIVDELVDEVIEENTEK